MISFNKILKVLSFNCHGLSSSLGDVKNLCRDYEIIFLQETWLPQDELPILHSIHPQFEGHGTSAMDVSEKVQSGRPHGGIGILLRKNLSHVCSIVDLEDCRLLALKITTVKANLYMVNVYLPYFSHENYDSYMYYLGKLNAIVSDLPSTKIAFLGDFNAHINGIFYKELVNFCQNMNLVISDCKLLGENSKTFTFFSDAHNSTSWLDHVLSSHSMHSCIDSIAVLDKLPCSDHLPVSISFMCNWSKNPLLSTLTREYSNKTCNWSKLPLQI